MFWPVVEACVERTGWLRRLACRCGILGVRAVGPLSACLVLRYAIEAARKAANGSLRKKQVLSALLQAVKVWSIVEAGFLLYFLRYSSSLNCQSTRRFQALTISNTAEKRRQSLDRYLLSLTQVCGVKVDTPTPVSKKPSEWCARRGSLQDSRTPTGFVRKGSFCFDSVGKGLRKTSSAVLNTISPCSSFASFGQLEDKKLTTEQLLSQWDKGAAKEDIRKFQAVELSSWFSGSGMLDAEDPGSWLRRGNVEDWISHYFFLGESTEQCKKTHKDELDRLVNVALEYFQIPRIPEGYNPDIKPMRIYTDALQVQHRPFFLYLLASCLAPFMTEQVMRRMGFHKERVGGLLYWRRPPRSDVRPEDDIAGPSNIPLVFIHGLGIGLVPYWGFIYRLSMNFSGDLYVPELPFLAMAPWESVPSPREVVAQLQDMLAANKHVAAHFAGHSYGTAVLSWMIKMSPSSLLCTTFMEPAAMLLCKSDHLRNVMEKPCLTCWEIFVRYFVFRELFTVKLLCRCFYWEQTNCWPEEVRCLAVVQLASEDHLVQSTFIRRMLTHENEARRKQAKGAKKVLLGGARSSVNLLEETNRVAHRKDGASMDILWCDGFIHGEILMRVPEQDILFGKMRRMAFDVHRSLQVGGSDRFTR